MALAKALGFDVELFYYGFTHSGKVWTLSNTILVFFVGNALTLLMAVLFERLYKKQRKYYRGIKMLFLWIYLVSIIWFLGNIIVGAFFNFGIGAAVRAFRVPFFLRLLLAIVAIYFLIFLGLKAQKHVRVSANLYYPRLLRRQTRKFFLYQIVLPVVFGLIIIVLLKIPHVPMYHYVDIYLLLTIVFFLGGLFYKAKSHGSMAFKTHDTEKKQLRRKGCNVAVIPLLAMFVVLALIRVGLINGLTI